MATSIKTESPAVGFKRSEDREWRGADGTCRCTISKRTLEQMRFECSRAMNGPGGQGLGGILLGTRLGDYFRIVRFEPIPCEHALGPDFHLTEREEISLGALIHQLQFPTPLQAVQPIGWFVSHPRGDLHMGEEEARLHAKHFGPGRLALVAKPDRLGDMEIALHYASDEHQDVRLMEPLLTVVPDASFRPPRRTASGRRHAARMQGITAESEQESESTVPPEMAQSSVATLLPVAAPGRRNLLLWAMLVLLVTAACGVAYWNWPFGTGTGSRLAAVSGIGALGPLEMLSLNAYEDAGRFYISWNGKAESLQNATHVTLIIRDGEHQAVRLRLSNREAAAGYRVYPRISSEVKVTLEVQQPDGRLQEESTLYASSEFSAPALLRATPETTGLEIVDSTANPPAPIKY